MKKGNTVLSRRTTGFFLVVAGFLGLLLVTNGALAQTYTEVFSDDFNRSDGTDIGSGWVESGSDWVLSGGQVWGTGTNRTINKPLLRPATENVLNGKAEFVKTLFPPQTNAWSAVARYTGTNGSENYYLAWILTNGQISITTAINGSVKSNSQDKIKEVNLVLPTGTLKGEFIVTSLSPTTTYLEFNVYNSGNNLLATATGTDSTPVLQGTGQRGVNSYGTNSYDSFTLYSSGSSSYPLITGFILTADKENIKVGTPITYTLTASTDQTITLSDDRGGTFSTAFIDLNVANFYTATLTYTPTQAGNAIITASGNDEVEISQIVAYPYATTIGYIGDSITQGVGGTPNAVQVATTKLGTGFTAINRGVSGSTTKSWVNSLLSAAISAFQSNGVEVVNIMLGTNDSKVAENISVDDYKTNLSIIIEQLKVAGIKKIILSEPPYIIPQGQRDSTSISKMTGYIAVIDELIDGEQVIRGDIQAYEYFEANQSELPDKIHPNSLGHQHLGVFRAEAIMSALDYQINPNASFLSGNAHTLGTTGSLTFRVDKYFGEFNNVVKVDGVQLATSDYEAISGSTTIELNADYLNTLSAGDHTLTVGFEGGVEVVGDFTILSEPTVPPVTPPTVPSSPTYAGGGGGGISLVKDSCPNGDLSPSYYDKTCGTTTDLTEEVAKKVNALRPIIRLIYLTATEEQKTFVHNLITSCSEANKNEVIKLACQELVEHRDF